MNRASIAVKRLPWTNTKPSRLVASVNGMNRKTYSLECIPSEVYDKGDDAIARYIAETYSTDKGLHWTLSEFSTIHKGEYIFIAV